MSESSPAAGPIVHVSANLRSDGGGAAQYGRLVGGSLRRFASRRRLRFRGFHLAASDGHPALDGYASLGGSRLRLAATLFALQTARRPRPRLLVFDHPGPSRVQAWIPGAARSPYAVSILGIDAWRPLAADRVRALAGARAVVAISRTTAERARPFLPSGCRAEVIHPGLERALRGGDPDRSLCDSLGQGFVAIVARLRASERYKGHEPLFEAWPEVRARVPGARLVVVGDGDDRTRLEERARALGSGESVTFTGAVSPATLDDIYRRAALVAMPSRDEGFGLVFLEAMEHALPCLALAGTAPGEIIEAGRTGLLVEGGSPAALAAALVELLANPERSREMGREGRRQFLAGFTAEAFERRFEPRLDAWLSEGAG